MDKQVRIVVCIYHISHIYLANSGSVKQMTDAMRDRGEFARFHLLQVYNISSIFQVILRLMSLSVDGTISMIKAVESIRMDKAAVESIRTVKALASMTDMPLVESYMTKSPLVEPSRTGKS